MRPVELREGGSTLPKLPQKAWINLESETLEPIRTSLLLAVPQAEHVPSSLKDHTTILQTTL